MKKSEITKELVAFLKKEGCYEEYMQCFDESYDGPAKSEHRFITYAFDWGSSSDGSYNFWDDINDKWQAYLKTERTPFMSTGYTKDTVFKVVDSGCGFMEGELVRISEDDRSFCPLFENVDNFTRYAGLPLSAEPGVIEWNVEHDMPQADYELRLGLFKQEDLPLEFSQVIDENFSELASTGKEETKMEQEYVWLNSKGEYLVVSQSETHTGTKVKYGFTSNLKLASVLGYLPKDAPKNLIQIPARVERKVILGVKE